MKIEASKLPLGRGVTILAWDDHGLLALTKPEGILSHPNKPSDIQRSLLACAYDSNEEAYRWKLAEDAYQTRLVWLLNRLDSATSGAILCALDSRVADAVRIEFEQGRVEKRYLALVFGALSPHRQVWRDHLGVSRRDGKLRASAEGGAFAETEARLLHTVGGFRVPLSVIELRPLTGRTHQLRVQCAKRGLPIVGDQTYGNFGWNREYARLIGAKRLFLHSTALRLTYLLDGRRNSFKADSPPPSEFGLR